MNLYRSGHLNTDVLAVRVMLPLVLLVHGVFKCVSHKL